VTAACKAFNNGAIDLATLQRSDAAYVTATRTEIACEHGYAWPPSVTPLEADLQAQAAVIADYFDRLSKAPDLATYDSIGYEPALATAGDASDADASKIRRALGLPARK
jgi:hypothetical protein